MKKEGRTENKPRVEKREPRTERSEPRVFSPSVMLKLKEAFPEGTAEKLI